MATNVTAHGHDIGKGRYVLHLLGTGAGAVDDGDWIRSDFLRSGTVHIYGGTGSVAIYGSNEDTAPADSDDAAVIQSATAAEAIISITNMPRWIKAKVTAFTSGTIMADLIGEASKY